MKRCGVLKNDYDSYFTMKSRLDFLQLEEDLESTSVLGGVAVYAKDDDIPAGVLQTRIISTGLVELTFQAGDPSGYGSRTWPVRAGGAGLGDDESDHDAALARLLGLAC
jgi:hypothetical protein